MKQYLLQINGDDIADDLKKTDADYIIDNYEEYFVDVGMSRVEFSVQEWVDDDYVEIKTGEAIMDYDIIDRDNERSETYIQVNGVSHITWHPIDLTNAITSKARYMRDRGYTYMITIFKLRDELGCSLYEVKKAIKAHVSWTNNLVSNPVAAEKISRDMLNNIEPNAYMEIIGRTAKTAAQIVQKYNPELRIMIKNGAAYERIFEKYQIHYNLYKAAVDLANKHNVNAVKSSVSIKPKFNGDLEELYKGRRYEDVNLPDTPFTPVAISVNNSARSLTGISATQCMEDVYVL